MPVENLCLWSSLNDSSVYCCLLGCCVLLWCYHSRLMQREMWHQSSGFSLRSFHESQSTMHVICTLLLCGLLKFRERAKQSTTLPRFRRKAGGQGTWAIPLRRLLRRLPAPRVPPPGWFPRTPATSLPPAHLLHECADKYHGCTWTNVRDARGMHMFAVVCIFQFKPYSNHFTYQVYTT